jgi:hypothetical protein
MRLEESSQRLLISISLHGVTSRKAGICTDFVRSSVRCCVCSPLQQFLLPDLPLPACINHHSTLRSAPKHSARYLQAGEWLGQAATDVTWFRVVFVGYTEFYEVREGGGGGEKWCEIQTQMTETKLLFYWRKYWVWRCLTKGWLCRIFFFSLTLSAYSY